MCDQTQVDYLPGDIVWVKVSSIWWPAEVQDEAKLDEDVTGGLKKKPLAIVKFFEEDSYEFPKNLDQIYHYNCLRKDEFIKKGLDLHRAASAKTNRQIPSSIGKFPTDVKMAEQLTKGDPDYIDHPKFNPANNNSGDIIEDSPVKKMKVDKDDSISSSLFPKHFKTPSPRVTFAMPDGKSSKKQSSKSSIPRRSSLTGTPHSILKKNKGLVRTYRCPICEWYSTFSRDVIRIHVKQHLMGLLPEKPPSVPKKYREIFEKNYSRQSAELDAEIPLPVVDDTQLIKNKKPEEPGSPIKKKKNETPNEKTAPLPVANDIVPTSPQKKRTKKGKPDDSQAEALKILADWDDDLEDEGNATSKEIPKSDALDEGSTNENNASDIFKSEVLDSKTPAKDCFDFEDNDDSINVDHALKFGQKLPRVITDKQSSRNRSSPKREDTELLMEVDNFLEEIEAPVMPQIPTAKHSYENDKIHLITPEKKSDSSASNEAEVEKSSDLKKTSIQASHNLEEEPATAKKERKVDDDWIKKKKTDDSPSKVEIKSNTMKNEEVTLKSYSNSEKTQRKLQDDGDNRLKRKSSRTLSFEDVQDKLQTVAEVKNEKMIHSKKQSKENAGSSKERTLESNLSDIKSEPSPCKTEGVKKMKTEHISETKLEPFKSTNKSDLPISNEENKNSQAHFLSYAEIKMKPPEKSKEEKRNEKSKEEKRNEKPVFPKHPKSESNLESGSSKKDGKSKVRTNASETHVKSDKYTKEKSSKCAKEKSDIDSVDGKTHKKSTIDSQQITKPKSDSFEKSLTGAVEKHRRKHEGERSGNKVAKFEEKPDEKGFTKDLKKVDKNKHSGSVVKDVINEKIDKPPRNEKTEKEGRSKSEKHVKHDKSSKTDKHEKSSPEKSKKEKHEKSSKHERIERQSKSPKIEKHESSEKHKKDSKSEKTEKEIKIEKHDKTVKKEKQEKSDSHKGEHEKSSRKDKEKKKSVKQESSHTKEKRIVEEDHKKSEKAKEKLKKESDKNKKDKDKIEVQKTVTQCEESIDVKSENKDEPSISGAVNKPELEEDFRALGMLEQALGLGKADAYRTDVVRSPLNTDLLSSLTSPDRTSSPLPPSQDETDPEGPPALTNFENSLAPLQTESAAEKESFSLPEEHSSDNSENCLLPPSETNFVSTPPVAVDECLKGTTNDADSSSVTASLPGLHTLPVFTPTDSNKLVMPPNQESSKLLGEDNLRQLPSPANESLGESPLPDQVPSDNTNQVVSNQPVVQLPPSLLTPSCSALIEGSEQVSEKSPQPPKPTNASSSIICDPSADKPESSQVDTPSELSEPPTKNIESIPSPPSKKTDSGSDTTSDKTAAVKSENSAIGSNENSNNVDLASLDITSMPFQIESSNGPTVEIITGPLRRPLKPGTKETTLYVRRVGEPFPKELDHLLKHKIIISIPPRSKNDINTGLKRRPFPHYNPETDLMTKYVQAKYAQQQKSSSSGAPDIGDTASPTPSTSHSNGEALSHSSNLTCAAPNSSAQSEPVSNAASSSASTPKNILISLPGNSKAINISNLNVSKCSPQILSNFKIVSKDNAKPILIMAPPKNSTVSTHPKITVPSGKMGEFVIPKNSPNLLLKGNKNVFSIPKSICTKVKTVQKPSHPRSRLVSVPSNRLNLVPGSASSSNISLNKSGDQLTQNKLTTASPQKAPPSTLALQPPEKKLSTSKLPSPIAPHRSPNILQKKTVRQVATPKLTKVTNPPSSSTSGIQPDVQSIPAPTGAVIYLTVDEQGNCHPSPSLSIPLGTLQATQVVDKKPKVTQVQNVKSGKPPRQDILAKALANSIQSDLNEMANEDFAATQFSPTPLSTNILSTSLTLSQGPIMSPVEVPSRLAAPSSVPLLTNNSQIIYADAASLQLIEGAPVVVSEEGSSCVQGDLAIFTGQQTLKSFDKKDDNVLPEFLKGDFSKRASKNQKSVSDR